MRKILEDLYYSNIRSAEHQMAANSKLRQALETIARCEKQLFERLGETEKGQICCIKNYRHLTAAVIFSFFTHFS